MTFLFNALRLYSSATDPQPGNDWDVTRSRASVILWGMPREVSTLEIRARLDDLELAWFVRGRVFWEGEHVRLILTRKDSRRISRELVNQVSHRLRRIGCRCVLD